MDMDLSETFKMFDTDGDGTVDLKEAKQAQDAQQDAQHDLSHIFTLKRPQRIVNSVDGHPTRGISN